MRNVNKGLKDFYIAKITGFILTMRNVNLYIVSVAFGSKYVLY